MKVYTVTKEGVYRHEILGIYTGLNQAMAAAESIAGHVDEDGYHAYQVGESELNINCKDVTPLYLYQKSGRYTGEMGDVEVSRFENGKWVDVV